MKLTYFQIPDPKFAAHMFSHVLFPICRAENTSFTAEFNVIHLRICIYLFMVNELRNLLQSICVNYIFHAIRISFSFDFIS